MSFNQLPEELVTLIAEKMNPADVLNLLETQKRVNKILRQSKLDKPAMFLLSINLVNNGDEPFWFHDVDLKEGQASASLTNVSQTNEINNLDFVLSKFRSIQWLIIKSTIKHEYVATVNTVDYFSNGRYSKIDNLELETVRVELASEDFIRLCKHFTEINFVECNFSPNILSDKVLCETFPFVRLCIIDGLGILNTTQLTDATLEAAAARWNPTPLILNGETMFTVAGIRNLFEKLIQKNEHINGSFGILGNEQNAAAIKWMNFVKKHTELPYTMSTIRYDQKSTYVVKCSSMFGQFCFRI